MAESTLPPYDPTEAKDLLTTYLWELKPDEARREKAARELMDGLLALSPPTHSPIILKRPDDLTSFSPEDQWKFVRMEFYRPSRTTVSIAYEKGEVSVSASAGQGGIRSEDVPIVYDPVEGRFVAKDITEQLDGRRVKRSPLALIIEAAWGVAQGSGWGERPVSPRQEE